MPSISDHLDYLFEHLLLFYAKFDFARQSICPGLDQQAFNGKCCPFKFRNIWQRADLEHNVIWLCDPCDQSRNLASRVNGNALRNIKASLKAASTDCKRIPGYFWTEASAHWENVGYTLNRYEPPLHAHKRLKKAEHKFQDPNSLGYWWWNASDGDWFLEDDTTSWAKYKDPETNKQYWWKNDDKWFWLSTV